MGVFSSREFKTGVENGTIFPNGVNSIVFASNNQESSDMANGLSYRLVFSKISISLFPASILLTSNDGQVVRLDAVRGVSVHKSLHGGASRVKVFCIDPALPNQNLEYTLLVF